MPEGSARRSRAGPVTSAIGPVARVPRFPAAARRAILAWYAERGRPLAFRRTKDPYEILVSEAMAQQTQAGRAAEYWERFIIRFPTVEALASATPAEVLRAWRGLGYDRRAIALWRSARLVVEEHDGRLPSSIDALRALPGVGPYTARAVAAIAFGARVGAVDVNVRRVLVRIVAGGQPLSPKAVQAIADAAVPGDQPGRWTHALMDLGATVCKSRAPRCDACPARPWCRFAAEKRSAAIAGPASTRRDPDRIGAAVGPTERAARGRPAATRASDAGRAGKGAIPFPSTTRWLRGRILDRLRATPDGVWLALDHAIGAHGPDQVRAAALALARDGVLELETRDDAVLHARLPLA